MGASYSEATPMGRVRSAEREYARGNISYNEARKRAKAEGYTLGSSSDIKNLYKRKRSK